MLRSRLGLLRELDGPREAIDFVGVCAFAATVPVLARLPLPRLGRLLARPSRGPRPTAAAVERLARLVGLAQSAGRPLVRGGCLTRGITMLWFLRRRGLDVELCFGLDVAAATPDGHCWLVLDGAPILECVDPSTRFAEQYRLGRGVS
jgi:hypothetical protein